MSNIPERMTFVVLLSKKKAFSHVPVPLKALAKFHANSNNPKSRNASKGMQVFSDPLQNTPQN
jgi:hypothetical protein